MLPVAASIALSWGAKNVYPWIPVFSTSKKDDVCVAFAVRLKYVICTELRLPWRLLSETLSTGTVSANVEGMSRTWSMMLIEMFA